MHPKLGNCLTEPERCSSRRGVLRSSGDRSSASALLRFSRVSSASSSAFFKCSSRSLSFLSCSLCSEAANSFKLLACILLISSRLRASVLSSCTS